MELNIQVNDLALAKRTKPTTETNAHQTGPIILTEPIRFQCKTLQATIINAPIFGGQWRFSLPNSSIYDRLLDVVIIADIKLETFLEGLTRIFGNHTIPTNSHSDWHAQNAAHPLLQQAELSGIQGVYHFQARGIAISSSVDPQDVTLDGEIRGQTPLQAHIAPDLLPVIVPVVKP
jgi:diacylglycerol kinase family enzyme